jgi:hypothetical protein
VLRLFEERSMGLKIHSLASLPEDIDLSYFIYLLDYGWEEPLSNVLRDNFDRLASFAAMNDSVVITGFAGQEFSNEVLSWHHVNGIDGQDVLPAIMITDTHPQRFAELNEFPMRWEGRHLRPADQRHHDRMVLIPLRGACRSATEVADLIEGIVHDIRNKTSIGGFAVDKRLRAGEEGALVDALVLRPSFGGVGIDLKMLGRFLRRGFDAWKRG